MDIWLRIGRGKVYYRYLILILLSDCMISISVCYLTGSVLSPFLRSISLCGTGYQRKFSFQLNPPYVISEPAMYSNVSSLITSMMGHTTVFLCKHIHTNYISSILTLLWPHPPEWISFVCHRTSLFLFWIQLAPAQTHLSLLKQMQTQIRGDVSLNLCHQSAPSSPLWC